MHRKQTEINQIEQSDSDAKKQTKEDKQHRKQHDSVVFDRKQYIIQPPGKQQKKADQKAAAVSGVAFRSIPVLLMKKGKQNLASSFFGAGAKHAFQRKREEGKNKNDIERRRRRLLCEGKKKKDGKEQELYAAIGKHQSPVGGKTTKLPCKEFF